MDISKWPKRYRWMVGDIRGAKEAGVYYLVGLGLFCYTEIVGRDILKYRNPQKTYFSNPKCFNLFLGEYMGYKKLLEEYGNGLYDWFRNGFCHNYSIKGEKTGVGVYYEPNRLKAIKELGVDITKGIAIPKDDKGVRLLVIEPYLKDFTKGIEKFLKESKQINQSKE